MKKYIISVCSLLSVLAIIGVMSPSVHAAADPTTSINGQLNLAVPSSLQPWISTVIGGVTANQKLTNFDLIATVPQNVNVAQVTLPNNVTINVQRFIDPSTSVACYYSEENSVVIEVNCVPVSSTAK